jgi:hypothetical protein
MEGKPEYNGIENALRYLLSEVYELRRELAETRQAVSLRTYTTPELARLLGVSAHGLSRAPWKLPNYGKPDIGERPGKWLHTTVTMWYAVPEAERRDKWERMSSAERRRTLGRI